MTLIAQPVIKDSPVLNHIARDLLIPDEDPNKTLLKRSFKVVTEDGIIHDVTFEQMDGLINILDLSRVVPRVTPMQYLVTAYNIEDLIEMGRDGWAVTDYEVRVHQKAHLVRFEGVLHKEHSADKIFSFQLGGFDFIQQFSLSRVIADQHEKLKPVAGTFDMSYTFRYGPNGISLESHEESTDEA